MIDELIRAIITEWDWLQKNYTEPVLGIFWIG